MRLPTLIFGLAAVLVVPALLRAEDAGEASKAQSKAAEPSKDIGKDTTGKDDKAANKDTQANGKPAPAAGKAAVTKAVAKAKAKPAKELFGAVKTPAPLASRAIGFYAKGCLAGAQALPVDGPAWQAMRLSRNRTWGHPELITLIQKLAVDAKEHDGWPGLLVGDISQPRGGPMLTGHASHQIGLDADVWLTPMPDRRLSVKEREEISATSMLAEDRVSVNPKVWTEAHVRLLRRAASYDQVERVLVHPAIKKAICDASKDEKERGWLSKIRAYWGHYYHFHIRIACPKGSTGCSGQPSVDDDNDGCGAELTQWLKRIKPPLVVAPVKPPVAPPPEKRPLTLDQLPEACRVVLASGTPAADKPATASDTKAKAAPVSPPAKKAAPEHKAKLAPKKASLAD